MASPTPSADEAARRRKANNALGLGIVALVMLLETVFAHHKQPNPASPYVWAGLGAVVVTCAVCWLRWRWPR